MIEPASPMSNAPLRHLLARSRKFTGRVGLGRAVSWQPRTWLAVIALALGAINIFLRGSGFQAAAFTVLYLLLASSVLIASRERRAAACLLTGIAMSVVLALVGMPLSVGASPLNVLALAVLPWMLLTVMGVVQTYFAPGLNAKGTQGDALTLALVATWLDWRALPVILVAACTMCIMSELRDRFLDRGRAPRALALPIIVSTLAYEVVAHVV